MLKLVEVADLLTNELNSVGANYTPPYTFNIQSEVGANKNAADVQGILISGQPNLPSTSGVKNAIYNLSVNLTINAPTTNYNLKNIEDIVGEVATTLNGTMHEFENGNGMLTMSLTQTHGFKTSEGQGNIVPLGLQIQVNYTENAVVSGQKKWELLVDIDGVDTWLEIPFLSEGVSVKKYGKTSNIYGEYYQKTLLTSQMKTYHFTFLYDGTNPICTTLQKDMLEGDATKSYGLRYSDGVTYTGIDGDFYETRVSILGSGDTKSNKPNTATMEITFADVDDGTSAVKYELALIDSPFDNGTENTRAFNNQQEQKEWFANLISQGADYEEIPAPNINSLTLTNQIYINTRNYNLFDLLNKDYAIIKVTKPYDLSSESTYFYYWVSNAQVGMNNQVVYDLKIDSVQTLLFRDDLEIQGTYVQQGHTNRWIDNGDGTISFDGTINSKLFEREKLTDIAKRLVSREKLKYYTSSSDTNIRSIVNYLNTYVSCWCYVYLSEGDYTIRVDESTTKDVTLENAYIKYYDSGVVSKTINGANAILCFPIFKENTFVNILRGYYQLGSEYQYIYLSGAGFDELIKLNDQLLAKVRSIKLSVRPPFDYGLDINASNDIQFNLIQDETDTKQAILSCRGERPNQAGFVSNPYYGVSVLKAGYISTSGSYKYYSGVFYIRNDNCKPVGLTTNITMPQLTFNKANVVGDNKDIKYNPKINSEDYKSLVLTISGNQFEYPINKLNTTQPIFEYYEVLSPTVTKGILKYTGGKGNEIYGTTAYKNSFNGFVYSNDFTIALSVDEYSSFIANNKNFYTAFENKQSYANTKFWMQKGEKYAKNPLKIINPSSAVEDVFDAANHLIDLQYEATQQSLTLDNLKSAPEVLQNANGDAILTNAIAEFGIYVEIYEGLPHELQMANEIMFRDGFTYNLHDDVFNFINKGNNVRKYFNYVRAVLGNLNGTPMSNTIRQDLRQRFMQGIRFWHQDQIDYSKENYETWINIVNVSGFTQNSDYRGYYILVNGTYTKVTILNEDNLGIVPGTTPAYYKGE